MIHREPLGLSRPPKSWTFRWNASFAFALSSGESVTGPPPPEHPGIEKPRTAARHARGRSLPRFRGDRLSEHIRSTSSLRGQEESAALSAEDLGVGTAIE